MGWVSQILELPGNAVGALVTTLLFQAALVTISVARKRLFGTNRKSFYAAGTGVFLLALGSLHSLYSSLGLLDVTVTVWGLSVSDLMYWVLTGSGMILLIRVVNDRLSPRGVLLESQPAQSAPTISIPLNLAGQVNHGRNLNETIQGLSLWLASSARSVVTVTFLRFSNRLGVFTDSDSSAERDFSIRLLDGLRIGEEAESLLLNRGLLRIDELVPDLPKGVNSGAFVAGVKTRRKLLGCFVCKLAGEANISTRLRRNLEAATALTAGIIQRRADSMQLRFAENCGLIRSRIDSDFTKFHSTPERLTRIFRKISELVETDYVALSICTSLDREVRRYSSGPSGRFLLQTGLPVPGLSALVGPAFHYGEVVTSRSILAGHQPAPLDFIVSSRVKSIVAIPYQVSATVSAVLMLASERRHAFPACQIAFLQDLAQSISRLVLEDIGGDPSRRMAAEPEEMRKRIFPFGASATPPEFVWPSRLRESGQRADLAQPTENSTALR